MELKHYNVTGDRRYAPKPLSCWPLAFSAGLLGIGQNGLLVVLPVLVIQTNLSLSVWAALLMLGSMLFLPSSPCWGKQISRTGSKPVVLWALGGYGISFTLLGLGSVLMATSAITTAVGLGILIIARIAYGLTVSAMVPACQVWALQRAGEGNRMAALATISSGLSCGRLFGPLCAAAMLAIHPLAPLGLLMAAPVLALLMLLRLPGTPPQPTPECKSVSLKRDCLPYLLCAILLAAAVSMMQLGLSPALTRQFATDTTAISQQVAAVGSVRSSCAYRAVRGTPSAAPDSGGPAPECRSVDEWWSGYHALRTAMVVLPGLCSAVI